MTTTIAGLNYYEIQFDATGQLTSDGGLAAAVGSGSATELFVLTHGWNNDVGSARRLYQNMFTLLAPMIAGRPAAAAVGLIWPSLLFPEDDPGSATPAGTPVASTGAQLAAALTPAFPGQSAALTTIGTLLDQQPQDPAQLQKFHALAASLVTTAPLAEEDSGESAAATGDTAAVFGHAAAMAQTTDGNAEAFPNPFTTLWSGAREVLRTLSYYEMKNRAGVIGRNGLGPMLTRLTRSQPALRVHLTGHSFGARLVSFALSGLDADLTGPSSPVKTLYLVQGAFSHFSFANPMPIDPTRSGALAGCTNRVDGPLLATFSAADRAVGWWYPAASMLKHEDAQSITDLTYRWGGMGHDGYQQAGSAQLVLNAQGQLYELESGHFYLLDANNVIKNNQSPFSGAHSDIEHAEVLWALAAASRKPA